MFKPHRLFKFTNRGRDAGIFREIPLNIPGRLFVSPMPTGAYDPGNLLKLYKYHRVNHIFSLVTDDEIAKKARKDIFKEYTRLGITYSRFQIKDFQAPTLEDLRMMVSEAVELLNNDRKILVHCHAGVGRTALAVSCIVMAAENVSIDESIQIIKSAMMVNLTSEQAALGREYYSKFIDAGITKA